MDFTIKRKKGCAFLNSDGLRISCREKSGANQRHRRSRDMDTGESIRARHEATSRVSTPAQRGILKHLVTSANCLNTWRAGSWSQVTCRWQKTAAVEYESLRSRMKLETQPARASPVRESHRACSWAVGAARTGPCQR